MCTKENLTVFNLGINTLLLVSAAILLLMSFLLILNGDWAIAYEGVAAAWGGGLLFSSMVLSATACVVFYGTKRHNKCFLALGTLTGITCMVMEFSIAQNILIWAEPEFPYDVMTQCLDSPGVGTYPKDPGCIDIFNSHDNVAMSHLWMEIYIASLDDETKKQQLVDVETSHYCCGLGPAEKCGGTIVRGAENFTLWGDEIRASPTPVVTALDRCSERKPVVWYTESFYCKVQSDELGIRGCPYMFSVSTACLRDRNVRQGCLAHFHEDLAGEITPVADTIFFLLCLQASAVLSSFCLCLKRKHFDVLPPPEPFVDPKFKKYAVMKEPNKPVMTPPAADGADGTESQV